MSKEHEKIVFHVNVCQKEPITEEHNLDNCAVGISQSFISQVP